MNIRNDKQRDAFAKALKSAPTPLVAQQADLAGSITIFTDVGSENEGVIRVDRDGVIRKH